jgi:hypothetical protein
MKITTAILFYTISILSFAQNPIFFRAKMTPMKHENPNQLKIKITIGNKKFDATLLDNETALAFKKYLPIEIKMIELNDNEKYFEVKNRLPTNPSYPRKIQIGDLMLYGDQTLVLFYKSFTTSYSYSSIGKIDNVEGLEDALGSGNPVVKFELMNR